MAWQPIESAPKDGTPVLLTGLDYGKGPGRHFLIGKWHRRMWREIFRDDPLPWSRPLKNWKVDGEEILSPGFVYITHWMPIPAPPSPRTAGEGEKHG